MKIYDYHELSDSQIIYEHKPLLQYILLIMTFIVGVLLILFLSFYVNLTDHGTEKGELLVSNTRSIVASSEGYLEKQVNIYDNEVKANEIIATINKGNNTNEITAPHGGIFVATPDFYNGAFVKEGEQIGELKLFRDMHIVSLLNSEDIRSVSEGDLIQVNVPELQTEFFGEVISTGAFKLEGNEYNVVLEFDNEYKSKIFKEELQIILTPNKLKETN